MYVCSRSLSNHCCNTSEYDAPLFNEDVGEKNPLISVSLNPSREE
jgi:hypothetical protein